MLLAAPSLWGVGLLHRTDMQYGSRRAGMCSGSCSSNAHLASAPLGRALLNGPVCKSALTRRPRWHVSCCMDPFAAGAVDLPNASCRSEPLGRRTLASSWHAVRGHGARGRVLWVFQFKCARSLRLHWHVSCWMDPFAAEAVDCRMPRCRSGPLETRGKTASTASTNDAHACESCSHA